MSDDQTETPALDDRRAGAARHDQHTAEARRRQQIFGDVLPESTADDRDPDSAAGSGSASEEWLKANVPPHHT